MEIEEICRENADTQKQNIPSDVISTHCTMYITMHASTQPSVLLEKTKATLYLLLMPNSKQTKMLSQNKPIIRLQNLEK